MDDLNAIRQPLRIVVEQAGRHVLELRDRFRASGRIGASWKDDRSPVTEADLEAHRVLEGALRGILDVPIVSEEGADREAPGDGFWLVDPLDGTKEFLKGRDEWTVNVALVRDGRPVAGMVAAPALHELWWGLPGQGAWRREGTAWVPIMATMRPDGPVRAVVSVSHRGPDVDLYLANLRSTGHDVQTLSYGSSLKICRVAEGAADVYPRLGPTMHWDTAAAHAVLEGAGGQLTDLHGRPLTYGKGEFRNPHFVAGAPGMAWWTLAATA